MDIKSVPPPMGMPEQKPRKRRGVVFGYWGGSQQFRPNILKTRKQK
jgi:hypothetical protein